MEIGGIIENKGPIPALKDEVEWIGAIDKPIVLVLEDGREIRFKGVRVVDWGELRLCIKGAEITRHITCDNQNMMNGYKYKCPKLSNDDWDELESPCDGCSHRTSMTIVEKV